MPRFRVGHKWTVELTVEIKLRFRVGLEWTVELTVEIKLPRFSISPNDTLCAGRAYEFWSILYAIRLLMTTCVLRFTNWLTCQVNLRIRVCRENTLDEHGKETCSPSGL